MRVACVNQDPGIAPGRRKGASVHLGAMQAAFRALDATPVPLHSTDGRELQERLRQEGPFDLVYERYALGRPAAAEFARRMRIPYVLEVNAPLEDEEREYRGREVAGLRAVDELVFGSATRVIAVSSLVAAYAVSRGAAAERVRVFHNGVDPDRFHPCTDDDALRARLAPPKSFVLGFHGRLRPWHAFDQLAAAVGKLIERGLPVHLVVVGEGDFDAHLRDVVPAERVTQTGWVPHDRMPRYVSSFDVLPLTYDAARPCYFSPLKLPEAMACGVVPVVPEVGDLPDIVTHEESGLLYPAGDVDALADAVQWLSENPARRAAMASAALRAARSSPWIASAAYALGLETSEVKSS